MAARNAREQRAYERAKAAEKRDRDRLRRQPEEIVLRKAAKVAQRLVGQGRQRDAEVVLAAATLVADILAAEFGRAPHPAAGLVWDRGQARYVDTELRGVTEIVDVTAAGEVAVLHPLGADMPILDPRPTISATHQIGCCAEETTCTKCGLGCCPIHDEIVTTCDDSPHHYDEQDQCLSCTIIARDDHADEMAVEDWKDRRS